MRGSSALSDLARKPPEPKPSTTPAAEQDQDSWEEPTGDGRNSRHQVFGLQLIDVRKAMIFIPYGSIIWGEGTFNGTSFRFEFSRGEQLWEAVIEGSVGGLQPIVDRLTSGKRESCRVNGESISRITWRDITPKEEAEG